MELRNWLCTAASQHISCRHQVSLPSKTFLMSSTNTKVRQHQKSLADR